MTTSSRIVGLLRSTLGPVLAPVYGQVVARRNRAFDRGAGVVRVGVPVVSVGNLTVGGTGKTPMVAWLVARLLEQGLRPAIAMRGYRARGGLSDEAEVYRQTLPGVRVLVGPDRARVIAQALGDGKGTFDCVVLDDGMQHRQLARNLDVVLIDAQSRSLDDHLLPWGDLREPAAGLGRAGVVVLTHAGGLAPEGVGALQGRVRGLAQPGALVVCAEHVWTGVRVRQGGVERLEGLPWLSGRAVLGVCAVGRPERFLGMLGKVADMRTCVALPDHDAFSASTCAGIERAAALAGSHVVVMTEKDWTKARAHGWEIAVARPVLEMRVEGGAAVVERVRGACQGPVPG